MCDGDVEFPLTGIILSNQNVMARKMKPSLRLILRAINPTFTGSRIAGPKAPYNQAFLAFFTALVLSTTSAAGPFFRIDLIALFAAAFDE